MRVDREPESEPGRRSRALILGILIAAALILRLAFLDFGLPSVWNPDEIQASAHVTRWCRGDFASPPAMYRHPLLLRSAAFVGISAARVVAPASVGSPPRLETATLALRLVSVLFGTLSVPALYVLARVFTSRALALVAAGLFAVLPITVISAKYGVPDTMLSFWVLVSLALAHRIARGAPARVYLAGGLAAALAFGSKYNAVFLAIPLVVAHARAAREAGGGARRWLDPRRLGALAAGALVGLAASFPFALRDARTIVTDVLYERDHLLVSGHGSHRLGGGDGLYVFHFVQSLPAGVGALLIVLIVAGLGLMLYRRGPDERILLSFVVPYYVAMEHVYKIPPNFERYVLPLIGPYLIAAVLLAAALAPIAARRLGRRAPRPAIAAVILAAALGALPAIRAARVILAMRPGVDTRVVMARWIEENLPARTRAIAPLAPSYYPDTRGLSLVSLSPSDLPRRLAALRGPEPSDVDARSVHVLASSLVYTRGLDFPEAQPELARFYARVFAEGELLASFESPGGRYLYQNPTLRLYRMVQASPSP